VSLEEMTAYHSPVFKNQVNNILSQTEELKSVSPAISFKGNRIRSKEEYLSFTPDQKDHIFVKKRESKYLKELRFNLGDQDSSSKSKCKSYSNQFYS
jgi:hypothetical protein